MAVMKTIAITVNQNAPMTETANSLTGASSPTGEGWHDINWQQVHQNVRRLQVRIVKATQEKRWGKVKALQRLLTRSFSGKALAVKRVTENQGKRTPGVDGARGVVRARASGPGRARTRRGGARYECPPVRS